MLIYCTILVTPLPHYIRAALMNCLTAFILLFLVRPEFNIILVAVRSSHFELRCANNAVLVFHSTVFFANRPSFSSFITLNFLLMSIFTFLTQFFPDFLRSLSIVFHGAFRNLVA